MCARIAGRKRRRSAEPSRTRKKARTQYVGRECDTCGALLTEEDFVAAETVTVPTAETRQRVPNGQEVVTIVGGLELKTPPWANEMHEYPYIQWNMEVHQARLRAAYPHAADKIGSPVASGSQEYERLARLAQSQGGPLTEGGDTNINLITFQRTWLRPWAFFALEDKALRDELLEMFPDGAYVAFAGEAYCESRSENMDDHWRVLHALPGDGSSGRPALGDALISVQERFNTLSNLQMETYEYGIPPIYADSEVLDFDALQGQTAEPGAHYPARAKPGQSLAAGFFQPDAAEVPPDLAEHAAGLMGPVAQFLTGAFPALFGGAMSNNDTASGYAMARDQAMGRIGLVWRRMKFFHADIMLLAVDCFRRNRPNDVEVTLLGCGRRVRIEMDSPGGLEGKFVQLSGNGRAVSDALVAAARGAAAIAGESRSADAGDSGASGKYGADQANDGSRGTGDSGRGIAHEAVSRDCAAGRGDARRASAGCDGCRGTGGCRCVTWWSGCGSDSAEHHAG